MERMNIKSLESKQTQIAKILVARELQRRQQIHKIKKRLYASRIKKIKKKSTVFPFNTEAGTKDSVYLLSNVTIRRTNQEVK